MTDLDVPPQVATSVIGDTAPTNSLGPQAPFWIKLAIVVYALAYITMAMYLLVDCWVGDKIHLKHLLDIPSSHELPVLFVSAVYAAIGSILGAGTLDIVSFHKYVAVKQDFQKSHVWGYFVGPWLAVVLGVMVFALLQTGLLVFAGTRTADSPSDVANLGYLAIGFLSGFGWLEATERVREIVSRFFVSTRQRSSPRSQSDANPTPDIDPSKDPGEAVD